MTPHTLGERIPTVCRVADILRILQMSSSQFFALRKQGTFPIPELEPPLDSNPRFLGADVQAYLNGHQKGRRRRTA